MHCQFRRFYLCLFVATAMALPAFAGRKVALIAGGGGEDEGKPHTIFDEAVEKTAAFFKAQGYETHVAFDGRHIDTKRRLTRVLGEIPPPFNEDNFQKQIDDVMAQIRTGKLKAGDQVFIYINSHGSNEKDKKSHFISAEPFGSRVSLDKLIPLRDALEKAGVKLAIQDNSCYSGHSQELASEKTCVITATSPTNLAYASFAKEFAANLEKGKSVEELFLKVRRQDVFSAGQPMISTHAGKAAHKTVEEIESSLLAENILEDNVMAGAICPPDGQATTQLNEIKRLLQGVSTPFYDLCASVLSAAFDENHKGSEWTEYCSGKSMRLSMQKLEKAVQDYSRSRTSLEKAAAQVRSKGDRLLHLSNWDSSYETTVSMWANFNPEQERNMYKALMAKYTDEDSQAEYRRSLRLLNSREKLMELLPDRREYQEYMNAKKLFDQKMDVMFEKAREVAKAERSIYEYLYKQIKKDGSLKEPCAEFKL